MTLLKRIWELIDEHGSLRVAGAALGLDHAYLHRLKTGQKDNPSKTVLRKLKLRRVVTYERIRQS